MLINHNEARVIHYGQCVGTGKKESIFPGVHNYDAKFWAEAEKHPHIKMRLEDGSLEVLSDSKEDAFNLKKFPVARAKQLVAQTLDRDLLKAWNVAEKREPVKAAIAAQLAEIADVKFRDKKEGNDDEADSA